MADSRVVGQLKLTGWGGAYLKAIVKHSSLHALKLTKIHLHPYSQKDLMFATEYRMYVWWEGGGVRNEGVTQ